jgi:hypothetical protein
MGSATKEKIKRAESNPAVALRTLTSPTTLPLMSLERIGQCRGTKRSNCRGTALFISGVLDSDIPIRADQVNKYLNPEKAKTGPKIGSLIGWHAIADGRMLHLAVVTSPDPLLLTHRDGSLGRFKENQAFNEMDAAYKLVIACRTVIYTAKPKAEL